MILAPPWQASSVQTALLVVLDLWPIEPIAWGVFFFPRFIAMTCQSIVSSAAWCWTRWLLRLSHQVGPPKPISLVPRQHMWVSRSAYSVSTSPFEAVAPILRTNQRTSPCLRRKLQRNLLAISAFRFPSIGLGRAAPMTHVRAGFLSGGLARILCVRGMGGVLKIGPPQVDEGSSDCLGTRPCQR